MVNSKTQLKYTSFYYNGRYFENRSSDGTCIITNSDDSILRIYDTTVEMLNTDGKDGVELVNFTRYI